MGFDLDGSHVWLSTTDEMMRRIPVLGGDMRPHLGDEAVNADYSPDGTRVVYHTGGEGDPMFVADADGQNRQLLSRLGPGEHQHFPTWSADGDWIFFVRGDPGTQEMDLWRVRPDGSSPERLTRDVLDVAYPAPIDTDTVLFIGMDSGGAGPWLWSLDVRTGTSRRASIGIEHFTSVAAAENGRRLVATVANPLPSLWRLPIPSAEAVGAEEAVRYPGLETVRASSPRFGAGGTLYYLSSGALWRDTARGPVEVLQASEAAASEPPAVSPDGESLAVVSSKRGSARLHVVSEEGAVGPPLSEGVEVRGSPAWSADGEWIAIGGSDAAGPGLFLFSREGGQPRRLLSGVALNPVWSPTDDLIVYAGEHMDGRHVVRGVRPSDGSQVELPEMFVARLGQRMRFLPSGRGLVYVQGVEASQDFWLLDLDTNEQRQLSSLGGVVVRTFDVHPDGDQVVFDRFQANSDIVLIELEGEEE